MEPATSSQIPASDREIFNQLRQLSIVETQYEFSRLMGRASSYYSCLRVEQRDISAAALMRLKHALQAINDHEADLTRQQQITALLQELAWRIEHRLLATPFDAR